MTAGPTPVECGGRDGVGPVRWPFIEFTAMVGVALNADRSTWSASNIAPIHAATFMCRSLGVSPRAVWAEEVPGIGHALLLLANGQRRVIAAITTAAAPDDVNRALEAFARELDQADRRALQREPDAKGAAGEAAFEAGLRTHLAEIAAAPGCGQDLEGKMRAFLTEAGMDGQ